VVKKYLRMVKRVCMSVLMCGQFFLKGSKPLPGLKPLIQGLMVIFFKKTFWAEWVRINTKTVHVSLHRPAE
jgi:hypothetical protein